MGIIIQFPMVYGKYIEFGKFRSMREGEFMYTWFICPECGDEMPVDTSKEDEVTVECDNCGHTLTVGEWSEERFADDANEDE